MSSPVVATFQIGKNGVSENTLNSLNLAFKYHKQVRVSILKSFCRDRIELKKIADQLQSSLNVETKLRIIGYTLVFTKLGKKVV